MVFPENQAFEQNYKEINTNKNIILVSNKSSLERLIDQEKT